MFDSYDIYHIKIYSAHVALELARQKGLKIRDFHQVEEYTYEFKASPKDKKGIIETFSSAILIKRTGPYSIGYNLIMKKTTLISLVFALVFFWVASTRIYRVDISGGSPEIDSILTFRLSEHGLSRFKSLPKVSEVQEVQRELERELSQEIEFLEIKKVGLVIEVKYEKRREPIVLPELDYHLVASKEGVIQSILVEHGQKMVSVNDYVHKGDILVSATILTSDNQTLEVFSKAKVMAYTWSIITLELPTDNKDEAYMFSELIENADRLALKDTIEGQIDERNVMKYDYKEELSSIKVHYQILENIAISEAKSS